MSAGHKTDNGNLAGKLALRRYFLDRYHRTEEPRVFDACQGSAVLWTTLQREYPCRYWGVDTKPAKGRLTIDSTRVLAQSGWDFDVVDIDTYGAPWKHWEEVLKNAPGTVTVFLTIGATMFRGSVDEVALRAVGLAPLAKILPESFCGKLSEKTLDYCLAMSYLYGWRVEEAREAPPNKRTRYIGLRLVPSGKSAPATGGPP